VAAASPNAESTHLEEVLEVSRRKAAKPPKCIAMEGERRKANLLSYYLPTTTFQPMGIVKESTRPARSSSDEPTAGAMLHTAMDDAGRSALQLRRSELGRAFPLASKYMAALILQAFLEPVPRHKRSVGKDDDDEHADDGHRDDGHGAVTDDEDDESVGEDEGVHLLLLHQQQAWSRLSGFPETALISGPAWQSVLMRWLKLFAPGASLQLRDGEPFVTGVRRVHPCKRTPPLDGWDALQLLSFFRVARMVDIPHEGPRLLAQLPLAQVWPTLGAAFASAQHAIGVGGGRIDPTSEANAPAAALMAAEAPGILTAQRW